MTHAGRDGPRDRDARAGLPDVRDRGPRARRARTSTTTWSRSSELWARFSAVAAGNPYAWISRPASAEEIRTPAPTNRMIGFPYPKLHELEQRRRAGCGRADHVLGRAGPSARRAPRIGGCSSTPAPTATSTSSSPTAGDLPPAGHPSRRAATVLELAGHGRRRHRGRRPLLVLPVGGAARRRRSSASASTGSSPHRRPVVRRRAVEQLRHARDRHGDGRPARPPGGDRPGVGQRRLHHQAPFGVYRTSPPPTGFRHAAAGRGRRRPGASSPTGRRGRAGAVEAYTVMHDREGRPETGFAACLLADGRRAWGTTSDAPARDRPLRGRVGRPPVALDADGALHV